MRSRRLLGVIVPFVSLAAAGSIAAQSGRISGLVRTTGTSRPVAGVVVSLHSDAGEIIQQVTPEGGGRFQFSALRRGIYYVSARAPGYQEARERADLFSTPHVSVFLSLVPDQKGASSQAPAQGAVDQRELLVPEGAQKELDRGKKFLFENKESARSIPHFRRAVEIYPYYASAYVFLGMAHMDLRQWKEAESALGKAIELNDKLAAAHLALGTCLNMQGNHAAAVKPLLRGLELNPETADGHYELGKAYWALGRWQEAEPHVRKALTMRPEFPTGHLLMGNILMAKRDAPAALKEFKEYLRLDPNGQFAAPTRDLIIKIEQALATQR